MFNMLRMDLRRLVKSRSFYVMLAVTALLLLLVVVMAAHIASPETLDAMETQGAEVTESDWMLSELIHSMSQMELMHETLGGGFLLVMAGIGVTIFVNGDFSSGFIKNTCCVKPRRRDYVCSKILLAGIYSGILTVFSVLLMLFAPVLVHWRPAPAPVWSIVQYTVWLWLPHWAFSLMALALVLLTRSNTLGIILSMVAGSGLTAMLAGTLFAMLRLPRLEQYFLSAVVCGVNTPQVGLILACTLVWSLIYAAGSLLFMEKRDI
ncbi:MAG: hypothetical protein HFG03_12540 [Oscillibacter sp.]|nr:hypothetical protein [Oscillibacter sp.]